MSRNAPQGGKHFSGKIQIGLSENIALGEVRVATRKSKVVFKNELKRRAGRLWDMKKNNHAVSMGNYHQPLVLKMCLQRFNYQFDRDCCNFFHGRRGHLPVGVLNWV